MSDFAAKPDDAVDQWLADQRCAMVNDLATTLDLEAGLREVMIPARYADLIADLHGVLDVEAGLSAIVSATPDDSSDADPGESPPDPHLATGLHGLVRAIASASPTSRLAMRTQPAPILIDALARAHDHADKLALILARARDRDLARARALARDRALARALAHARDRAHDLARDLDHDRDRDRPHAHDIARALAHALDLDLAHDRAHARALALVDDLVHARARARALARAHDRAHARALASALDELHRALNNFTGADLREADLAGVSLDGLRWSVTTQWPPGWAEQIKRDSVKVKPGIFEVRGSTTHAPTPV